MATATMASATATRNAAVNYRALGTCWIVYGVLRLGIAVWLVGFTRQATVMFGAMLVEVAHPGEPDGHVPHALSVRDFLVGGLWSGGIAGRARGVGWAEGWEDAGDYCRVFVAERVADWNYAGGVYAVGAVPEAVGVGMMVVLQAIKLRSPRLRDPVRQKAARRKDRVTSLGTTLQTNATICGDGCGGKNSRSLASLPSQDAGQAG